MPKLTFINGVPSPSSGQDVAHYGPHTPQSLDQNFANLRAAIAESNGTTLNPLSLYQIFGIGPVIAGALDGSGAYDPDTAARIAALVELGIPADSITVTLSPTERAARGETRRVVGYSVNGLPDAATQAQIDALLAEGWPDSAIDWDWLGDSIGTNLGTFTLPALTLRPVVTPPALAAAASGMFNLPGLNLQPVVAAPGLAGILAGSFATAPVSLQPAVTAPGLVGIQTGATAGSFTLPAVSVQPVVAAPALAGRQVGTFPAAAVSLQPVVSASSLAGVLQGMIGLPGVSLRPIVAVPGLTGIVGDTTAPAVTSFTIGAATGQTVPITAFTGSDNVAVTGYLISEANSPVAALGAPGWSSTPPTTYTTSATSGTVTLYPWVKDAAGNVSSAFATPRSFTVTTAATSISWSALEGAGQLRINGVNQPVNGSYSLAGKTTIHAVVHGYPAFFGGAAGGSISADISVPGLAHDLSVGFVNAGNGGGYAWYISDGVSVSVAAGGGGAEATLSGYGYEGGSYVLSGATLAASGAAGVDFYDESIDETYVGGAGGRGCYMGVTNVSASDGAITNFNAPFVNLVIT